MSAVRAMPTLGVCLALIGAGCRVPHAEDASRWAPPVNQLALQRVDWWQPLVRSRFLEFFPAEYAGPAVDEQGEQVIALTRDGTIHAVRFGGKEAWKVETANRFVAGATVRDGVVYIPGGDGVLYALDAKSGKERWRYAAGEELVSVPVVTADRVLVTSQNDTLFAIERESGKWVWQHRRETPPGFTIRGASGAAVNGDTAFAGFADGHLVALALVDGTVKWDQSLSAGGQFGDIDATPVVDEGRLYAASYREGLYSLDAETGEYKWQTKVSGINHLVKRGGLLFVTGGDRIEARVAENGRLFWSVPLKDRAAQRPVLATHFLAVPTGGELLFVDTVTGKRLLEWDPGRGVSAPATWSNGSLFVLSNLGVLYALDVAGAR